MRGRMQAIVAASVLALLALIFPPLGLLSAAAVALVALRNGFRDSGLVLAGSALAVALFGILLTGNGVIAIAYALVFWIPVSLVAIVLRESGNLARSLQVSLAIGAVAVLGVFLMVDDPAALWAQNFQQALAPVLQNAPADFDRAQFDQALQQTSVWMTGIMGAALMGWAVMPLLLARWWQSLLFNPGGFRREFLSVQPGTMLASISLGMMVLAAVSDGQVAAVARNLCILFFCFYLVIGVSVTHCILAESRQSRILLPLMYVLMLFVIHMLLPIALVGLTDSWANWRQRFIARDAG